MSGIKVLLDTNLVIGLLKAETNAVELLGAESFNIQNCAISQITRMELLSYPQLPADEERLIQDFLAHLVVLTIDESIEQVAIQFRRTQKVKLPDAIIAATAQVHGLRLLTLDRELAAKFKAQYHSSSSEEADPSC